MPGLTDLPKNLRKLGNRDFTWQLWRRDPGLFSENAGDHQAILDRLGWLVAPEETLARADEMEQFAREAADQGFKTAVLLGMGGSSLCPLVLSRIVHPLPGALTVSVLDTTSPGTIRETAGALHLPSTLFIVSSKSGTTIEPLSLYSYFREAIARQGGDPGSQFVAITDPGTPLEDLAASEGFRKIVSAPPDVGGRYSALTVFGMIPAALMKIDVGKMLRKAQDMVERCGPGRAPEDNPAVALGTWMFEQVSSGRDKLNLVMSPTLEPMALWIEQLLAESTGKKGRGIIPVAGETRAAPCFYGRDRCFLSMKMAGERIDGWDPDALGKTGSNAFAIELESLHDLGGEFFRWEMATAALGHFLGINPFDEPNVAESKRNSLEILDEYQRDERFPKQGKEIVGHSLTVYAPESLAYFHADDDASLMHDVFGQFISSAAPGDYLAILAYLPYSTMVEDAFRLLGDYLRKETCLTTTFGFGPRYLHSTGQIHKGGPPTGRYVFITEPEGDPLPIPGKAFTFGELHMSQALGDERALRNRGLPVLRIHLKEGAVAIGSLVHSIIQSS